MVTLDKRICQMQEWFESMILCVRAEVGGHGERFAPLPNSEFVGTEGNLELGCQVSWQKQGIA